MIAKETILIVRCDDCGIKANNPGTESITTLIRLLKSKGWIANRTTKQAICPVCRKRRISQ